MMSSGKKHRLMGKKSAQKSVKKVLEDLDSNKILSIYIWQQDGAPPHASDQNIQYLARQFGGRLIARRSEPFGGRDWAARSPDLNPLDYGTGVVI